jgi:hypothetical protein
MLSLHRNRPTAFTIVELLIAVTITVLIVVMLGTMFGSLSNMASRTNQRIDVFREARAALQMIERDLSAIMHASPAAYFVATTDPSIYSDPGAGSQKNHQLYALCTLKNRPGGNPAPVSGDMCAVGYYCRWETDPNGQRGRYVLRRYFRDSDSTFRAFQANGAGSYMGPTTLYRPSSGDDILASYVWNLQITVYRADGTIDPTYPNTALIVTNQSNPNVILPAAIEISFNAMSPEAARTLMTVTNNPSDWMNLNTSNQWYQSLIAPNAREFRTRITF